MSLSLSILIAAPPSPDCRRLITHVQAVFDSTIEQAATVEELDSSLEQGCPDILIVDPATEIRDMGVGLLRKLRKAYPELLILPLIPSNRRELIEELLSQDIFFYLHTPIEPAETTLAITRAAEHVAQQQSRASRRLRQKAETFHGMIGAGKAMRKLFDLIARIAEDEESTVLIRGESGTGKEMVAKAIHAQSGRSAKHFVPVNCAAIPDDLLESELFGYAKGAFTGATANKIGRIQYADGGTLFLDEIGDMKISLQAKLLRVLQEKEFEPVGALKAVPVDTRVLAATHCDLEKLVREGKFREDLYYRLSVIPLHIPPLRERREDIPLLVDAFIDAYSVKRNREPFIFSPQAFAALNHFEWRGNVRELENLIQHMSILYAGQEVAFEDLPKKFMPLRDLVEQLTPAPNPEPNPSADIETPVSTLADPFNDIVWHEGQVDFKELINSFETQLIVQALKLSEGNKKEAARLLNLKRTTLLEKIKKKELNNLWQEQN